MKNKWGNYAFKNRKVAKGYIRKHKDGDSPQQIPEASSSYSAQQSRKEEEVIECKPSYKPKRKRKKKDE